MFVLGLQGSPRKKGNTAHLLAALMEAAAGCGAQTRTLCMATENIIPCRGCGYCEKKGVCVINDDFMSLEGFALLRRADVIISATPVFFYNMTAQLKAFIDRCQTLWSRKYIFRLKDPFAAHRKGILLSVGATSGKNLFEAIEISNRYFFDAVAAASAGRLLYRKIEKAGDIQKVPELEKDIENIVKDLIQPLSRRKTILFTSRRDACRSQMAAAFAAAAAGDRLAACSAGPEPAGEIDPVMESVMQAKGLDLHYRSPRPRETVIEECKPDLIVSLGSETAGTLMPGCDQVLWKVPDPQGKPEAFFGETRDDIEQRVRELVANTCL